MIKQKKDPVKIIEALVEYAKRQNRPIAHVIREFLPAVMDSSSTYYETLESHEKRLQEIESKLDSMDYRIILKAQNIFWKGLGIAIAIIGFVVAILTFFISKIPNAN